MNRLNLKKALWFALALLPVAIVGGFFTVRYQFELYPPEIMEEALAQLGSLDLLMVISLVQTCGYALFCGFVGYLLADSLGWIRPFRPTARPIRIRSSLLMSIPQRPPRPRWISAAPLPMLKKWSTPLPRIKRSCSCPTEIWGPT